MTLVSKPLVSVVTPVFNGEPYLRECIESVLAQTYANWEYTIVNNCSSDRTLDIAQEYAKRDSRIRVHDNDAFVRVIENYNEAFRQVSPESQYCKVVAADDWLFPECLDRMVRLAEENPSVAIVGAYQLRSTGVDTEGLPYQKTAFPGRTICRMQLMGGPYVLGTPTTVLYRSSIVRSRHAFYNESNLHADDEACVEFLEHQDFGFVHQLLTFGRVQEGSMTSFSERLNTGMAGQLRLLASYGPKYLTDRELEQRLREVLGEYYRCLGKEVFKVRDRQFWRYHRARLAELGYTLSAARLGLAAVSFATDCLLNPKNTVLKAVRQRDRGL
jgi:glycosyltransferase involved in cell wall biosynthesis